MAKTNAAEFLQQVRQEMSRVTWPTRKETLVTTGMVFVMVFIAAAFFFVVDQVLSYGVRLVFGLGKWGRERQKNGEPLVRNPRLFRLREEGRDRDPRAGRSEGA